MTRPAPDAFSFFVKVAHVSANPVAVTINAEPGDLERLAETWKVPAVLSFTAEAKLTRWKRDGVRAKGQVLARILQDCVVTLEPVESLIDEAFEAIFVPEGSRLARIEPDNTGEIFLDPDGPDLPDTFSGDEIDIGASMAEFAALAIDPYPRKAGADFAGHLEGETATERKPSPFAVLKGLKEDKSGE